VPGPGPDAELTSDPAVDVFKIGWVDRWRARLQRLLRRRTERRSCGRLDSSRSTRLLAMQANCFAMTDCPTQIWPVTGLAHMPERSPQPRSESAVGVDGMPSTVASVLVSERHLE